MLSSGLKQSQRLSQKQTLSPQVIQYIKLLQKTTIELDQRIEEEMEQNPLLEKGEEEAEAAATTEEESTVDREEDWDWGELMPEDEYSGYKVPSSQPDESNREIPTEYKVSLAEHLSEQLSLLELDTNKQAIADQIVGSIDEDGYLRRPLESVVDDLEFTQRLVVTRDEVEEVLSEVQRLDPIGIASRNLQECLLVQLEMLPPETPGREEAQLILKRCYKAFTMKHFDKIMTSLRLDPEDVKEAYGLIQRMNPKPGEGTVGQDSNYIVPDFTVTMDDGEFVVSINGKNAPQLKVSKKYQDMLISLDAEKRTGKSSAIDTETRQFLKTKFEAARWFISSIEQRRQTMMKVMHAILALQSEFFEQGEGNLRPMILKDIADRIDMDISTVSRVVNGKYVQTEFGVYELKYFFSEGVSTESGPDVSNKEVKALVQSIIDAEDKSKPLSDQRIAKILEERGFKIARRTVTKYREALDISVARMRKEIVL